MIASGPTGFASSASSAFSSAAGSCRALVATFSLCAVAMPLLTLHPEAASRVQLSEARTLSCARMSACVRMAHRHQKRQAQAQAHLRRLRPDDSLLKMLPASFKPVSSELPSIAATLCMPACGQKLCGAGCNASR